MKQTSDVNSRHLPADQLENLCVYTEFPDVLRALHAEALRDIGFFTLHPTRSVEYPWVVSRLEAFRPRSVIDVGAGISVLPLRIARSGASVVTVDYSRTVRAVANRASWTEWGFLDYAQLDPAILSYNMRLSDAPISMASVDAIYCVSVIEHMPKRLRIEMLQSAAGVVRAGGRAFITLDLRPGTRRLWNWDRGSKVEDDAIHGSIEDFFSEADAAGWRLLHHSVVQNIPGAKTDVALLEFERTESKPLPVAPQALRESEPEKTETGKSESLRKRFDRIYEQGGWSNGKWGSASGAGSTLAYTEQLRPRLAKAISDLGINSMLDAPCGDFEWFKEVSVPPQMMYVGMDIVRDLVRKNQTLYSTSKRLFVAGDITLDPLPKVDLMMCRDCLFHLPNASIADFFENFLNSGIPWLLLTSHHNPNNVELPAKSGFRKINFAAAPYNFPKPRRAIKDFDHGFPARHLCLWSAEEIAGALSGSEKNS